MPNIPDKTDNTGQYLSATELNPFKNSVQGVITDAGGTLIESDSLQFRQALNSYASIANFYIDTGTATEYVLNPQGAFKAPIDASTTWNGMLIRFRPTNNNTGIATLRLAGLNGGLPFNILREDGTTIQAGDFSITSDAILRYDSTASAFLLLKVPNASQTVAGIIKTSTTALVNAGEDDLTAITPEKFKTKITAILPKTTRIDANTKYTIYYNYDGTIDKIEQYMVVPPSAGSTLSFPIPFPVECKHTFATPLSATTFPVSVAFTPISTTQFSYNTGNVGANGVSVMFVGY